MNSKPRLWRVEAQNISGLRAPSFYIETATPSNWTREESEQDAIRLAKDKSGLGRYPETWTFRVTHLENYFLLQSNGWEKWVKQGVYRLENGSWTRKPLSKGQ